jgi:hypothetical protein
MPTPVVRWFRNIREKLLGKFYDGPEPPARIVEMVVVWANMNPTATRAEWVRFVSEHAKECYRAGWVRGYEYTERDPDERAIISQLDPELIATAMDPNWRWSPEVQLEEDPQTVVPEMQLNEREEMERLLRQTKKERT